MGYFLGIDLGTSYFKTGIFDEKGRLCGLGRQPVRKNSSDGFTCELPVNTFWDTLRNCVTEAMTAANMNPESILSISYSSQANSFILLDRNNNPLTPIILWPDKRAENLEMPIDLLLTNPEFHEKTGLGINPNHEFALAKINWFQQMQKPVWEKVKSIMSISDYFTFILTGQKISDYSTASLTGMLDVSQCRWWNEMLELAGIEISQLSKPQRVGSYVGRMEAEGAKRLGLKQGIPFFLGGLDHHVSAIGAGLPYSRNISESTGTVLACVSYVDKYLPQPQICIAPGLDDNHYFQMAFDENGAVALEWYQKNYAPEFSVPELLEMAAKIDIGSEGLVAKSCVFNFEGLTGFTHTTYLHQHGHFIRAILESTSLSLSRILMGLPGRKGFEGVVSTGGGAKSRLWVSIKADMLDTSFFIPECNETACLGAAMLGAVGVNEFDNVDDAIKHWVRFKEIIDSNKTNNFNYKSWMQNS